MVIKVNDYTLPERIKAKMVLTLFKTHQKQKELGFTFCSKSDNIIIAKGDFKGSSGKVVIDSRLCEKDEKFLGGYHTHYGRDSQASAEDLHYCGVLKTICTGGTNDNKIRCNTWKGERQSVEEYNKMVYDIHKEATKSKNPKYQTNFDCIRTMNPLFSDEKYIKEKIDTELDEKRLDLLALRERGAPEYVIIEKEKEIVNGTEKRNRSSGKLIEKIKNASKKYYNEIEIR